MMLPPKVSRPTMAAQRHGSVKILVHPAKDSSDAIATAPAATTHIHPAAPRRTQTPYPQGYLVHRPIVALGRIVSLGRRLVDRLAGWHRVGDEDVPCLPRERVAGPAGG